MMDIWTFPIFIFISLSYNNPLVSNAPSLQIINIIVVVVVYLGNASKYRHRVTLMPINWAPIFSDSVEGRTRYHRYQMKRNRQRVSSLIGPINKGHQKYLAAQITHHKSKSKSVNVVFYNPIFLINVSCLKRNLTSQFRTFVCISYDRV